MIDPLGPERQLPKVMGILNVTPDSFSDGGNFLASELAIAHAKQLIAEGADIIDVGGESTRPGAAPVSVDEELARIVPVIEGIRQFSQIPISIDTSKSAVMQAAVSAGASIINDVNALRADGALELAARLQIPVCLMHMQGEPRTMQSDPVYTDVVKDVCQFLQQRVEECVSAGLSRDKIWLDPGIGFGKSLQHNLTLLRHTRQLADLGHPLLIGVSRKSMFGHWLQRETAERIVPSVVTALWTWQQGASILRVHDVQATRDALIIWQTLNETD